jgi:hypothetical protein
MDSYSTTVILSGAQPPWKPNGTRTGKRMVAIGSPAKSWASKIHRWSSAVAPGFRTNDRLRRHPARAIVMDLSRLALHVVLHCRAERHVVAPVRAVDIAIGLPAVAPIDPREFIAAVINDRLRQSTERSME